MLAALARLFNLILEPCYNLTGNWWAAILVFTLIVKVILLPLSLWCQKNSIIMVKLMPELNRIKIRHFGDRETIGEEQAALNKREHYHPMLSLVPLAVQIIILFGLVDVIHGITDSGAPGTAFLGLVPATDGGLAWIMPLAAGLSAVAMGCAQNRINPLQKEQSRAEKNFTNGLSIALSLFLGIFVAAGMAFYWVISNLSSILIQVICNLIINPKKYVDYPALYQTRDELEALNALGKTDRPWYRPDPLVWREKADYKRFFNVIGKHLVFYAEGSGYYKYFQGAIEWLLANSDVPIHYITKDPNDQVFELAKQNPQLIPYYISEKRLITLMMKMDADMVVTSLGDLDVYYIKRSYVRKDIEYVYLCHHMTSTSYTSHKEEYMNYDTLMCVNHEQVTEQRRFEEVYAHEGVRRKNLVPTGYDLLDRDIAEYNELVASGWRNERPVVLIGPSWQPDNLCDSCIDELIESLLGHGWRVIVRPHPEYVKRYKPRWEAILERWSHVPQDELFFEKDFSRNDTVFKADILITDWSSVAFEFSFCTKKPSLFINTTPKLNNPNYQEFADNPSDLWLRHEVGRAIDPDQVSQAGDIVTEMLATADTWHDKIADIVEGYIFNLGHGGQAAGEYILTSLLAKQQAREEGKPLPGVAPLANEASAKGGEADEHVA